MFIDIKTKSALLGIVWMLGSGICFVAVIGVVKLIEGALPAAELSFIRYVFGLLFFFPYLVRNSNTLFKSASIFKYIFRAVFHALAVVFWFYAMSVLTVAEVTAIGYMTPVFVCLGAVFFLKEYISYWRIGAIFVAFFGVLLILRPGFESLSVGHLMQLVASLFFAVSYLVVKDLTKTENSVSIVAMMTLLVTIALAPVAIYVWVTPSASQLLALFFVAIFATLGHFFMTKAFSVAAVVVVQPITFLQLVWATLLGIFIFEEQLDPFVFLGGFTIIFAVTIISYRETLQNKASRRKSF